MSLLKATTALTARGSATVPTRFVARTGVSVLALSGEALDDLNSEHPSVAAALYRAAAETLAAEYRWIAAENVALTS